MDHTKIQKRPIHPREEANILSILTFFYTLDLFKKGSKKPLVEDDLYEVPPKLKSKKLGDLVTKEWEQQVKTDVGLSVIRLCWKQFGLRYILLGLLEFCIQILITTVYPTALGKLISYFTPNQTALTKNDAYLYASAVIAFNFLHCFFSHQYHLLLQEMGMQIRIALVSLIYRKALKLTPSRLEDISIGKIVTLITKDVTSFEMFLHFANDIWISIIQTGILMFLIYQRIGVSTFAGVGFFLVILPIQIWLGSLSAKLRLKMCKSTDERLKYTQETFSAIRIIKIYTWEIFFEKEIQQTRKKEMKKLHQNFWLRSFIIITGILNSKVAFYILIITYTWLGNYMSAEIVYYLLTSFNILTHSLSILFPIAIIQGAELIASIKRLGSVLKAMEIQSDEEQDSSCPMKSKIHFSDITVEYKGKEILKNVSLNVETGLNLLTGGVGSGKSFLLKTILQNYKIKQGKLYTSGRISYASQEPWLFPSTIRQNILFGQPYDEKRYADVIRVCALIYDFQLLSDKDNTIVEDRGGNLSKGQQARINLARAIYRESDIYLLDDCLAALDAHVSDYIFKECFKKYLEGKLIILVSHNIHHVQEADSVILMSNGTIKSVVKPWELSKEDISEIEYVKIDDNNGETDNKENPDYDDDDDDKNETENLITETTIEKKVYKETKKTGKVDWSVYKRYFSFGGGIFIITGVALLLCGNQFLQSYTEKLVSKWVNVEQRLSDMVAKNITTLQTDLNGTFNYNELQNVTAAINIPIAPIHISEFVTVPHLSLSTTEAPTPLNTTFNNVTNGTTVNIPIAPTSIHKLVTVPHLPPSTTEALTPLNITFNNVTNGTAVNIAVSPYNISEFVIVPHLPPSTTEAPTPLNTTFNNVTAVNIPVAPKNFSELVTVPHLPPSTTEAPTPLNITFNNVTNATHSNSTVKEYLFTYDNYVKTLVERNKMLLLYSILIVGSALGAFISTVSLLFVAKRASIRIHKTMVKKILYSTMYFFDTNFVGNILNRFSRDLSSVDERLAFHFQHLTRVFLQTVGIIILIASVKITFLIPITIFLIILVFIRRAYLVSARNLKRLDAMTRSPILGHLNATLEGITTIRAFKTQDILINEFDRFQDLHTSANYSFITSQLAFGFIIDVICTILVGSIIGRFLLVDDRTSAGEVGLAISQALTLTKTLQWGIKQWTDVENNMTSVERVLEYTDVIQEPTTGQELYHWPYKGEIIYENVYLYYNNSDDYTLKNLNFVIKPNEKIGIVGRTGAGKSSIISSLFRLYEVKGKIIIDNVNIKNLTLKFLRRNLSIIPQEPVLFIGTIRENLDPIKLYSDEEIWQAIEVTHLKNYIPNLDFKISESGANFSVGQRQMICLARALLRKNKIIVLDEATANMDPAMDDLIHKTINENFKDCTIITIAHKIKSILNSDRIMVLDRGEIIELDTPENLLKNTEGAFYKMVEKAQLLPK